MKKYSLYFIVIAFLAWSSLASYFYLQRNQFPIQVEINDITKEKNAVDRLKLSFELVSHDHVWDVLLQGNDVSLSYQGKANKQDLSYPDNFISPLNLTQEIDERTIKDHIEDMQCEYSVFGKMCSIQLQVHQFQYVIKDLNQNVIASTAISLKDPDKTLQMHVNDVGTKNQYVADMQWLNLDYMDDDLRQIDASSTYHMQNSKFKIISGNLSVFRKDEFMLEKDIFGVYKYENGTYKRVIAQDAFLEKLHIIRETPEQLWIFRNVKYGDPAIEIYDHNGVLIEKTSIELNTLESLYASDDIIMLNVKGDDYVNNVHIWQKQAQGFNEIDVFHDYQLHVGDGLCFYQDHRIYNITAYPQLQVEVYDRDKGSVYVSRVNFDKFFDPSDISSQQNQLLGWQFIMHEQSNNAFTRNLEILDK